MDESTNTEASGRTPGLVPATETLKAVVPAEVGKTRRAWGYGLLVTATTMVVVAVVLSIVAIDNLATMAGSAASGLDYVRFGAHCVMTLAFVLFCYALLKAAERLLLPTELLRSTEDVRLLLGMRAPPEVAVAELSELAKAVAPLVEVIVKRGER